MGNNLEFDEFDLRLNSESEHKSLYPWSIDEVNENGKTVGQAKQIPYEGILQFTAINISFNSGYNIENHLDPKNKFEISDNEYISMELEPEDKNISLSMFGTNLEIGEFYLHIFPESEEKKEVELWGRTDPDSISIAVHVKDRKFKQLADLVTQKSLNSFSISILGAEGFYSRCSPGATINFVKVLIKEHELAIPEDSKIEPPRIGYAKDIWLYPKSIQKLSKDEENGSGKARTDKLEEIILKIKNQLLVIIFLLGLIGLILI